MSATSTNSDWPGFAVVVDSKSRSRPSSTRSGASIAPTATWAFVALTQWILGVRASYDGLVVDPVLPPDWEGFSMTREYRGATYRIRVSQTVADEAAPTQILVDGQPVEGTALPIAPAGAVVDVEVRCTAARGGRPSSPVAAP